ncbi:glutamate ABC transporter substrate-binding protein [Micrococcoides hystricis]|uniref:Transporter substrate-binding domain-containing protein n=1 Tax=Micrococcoides hystricis TaxID=1572761 RepID=A0ABV6P8I9_9MICC
MGISKIRGAAAILAVSALALTACSPSSEKEGEGSGSDEKLTIGIKFDQPGLGFREGSNQPTGFDTDVARFIAKELGFEEDQIEWKQTPSANRENALENKEVDMIMATYSITDERKQRVDFAGPYFVAGQDLLVRKDDTDIKGPEDLDGKKLCSVTGSTSAQKIKDTYAKGVSLVEQGGYAECVTYLESGQVDAVTTDDIILAGLAGASNNKDKFKVVGNPFSEERYGVGLPKGEKDRCEAINAAIEKMKDGDEWQNALDSNTEGTGYEPDEKLNTDVEMETCEG